MKWYGWIIIIVVFCAGSFTGGYFYGKSRRPQEAAIIDETPTHTEHDTPPVTADPCAWYKSCYKSPMTITGEFDAKKKDWFNVEAFDAGKRARKAFKIGVPVPPVKHNSIFTGYALMYDIDSRAFRHNVDANYLYSFGRVFIGGGAAFQFDRDRLYQAGPRISAGFTF